MNEELTLAIDELRLMPTDRAWFIPVKLSPCEVPSRSIGGGETLQDLQFIELYANPPRAVQQIASVILGPRKQSIEAALKATMKTTSHTLRSVSRNNLSIEEAITMIREHDFYERSWNKLGGNFWVGRYHLINEDLDGVIASPATGLLWQQRAQHFLVRRACLMESERLQLGAAPTLLIESEQLEPHREDHIREHLAVEDQVALLNQNSYAGFSDWRLPTLEEALSIIHMNGRVDYRFGRTSGRMD